ncbi:MAG TPA: M28 family peptidase [Terriglobia bacterium]|nr:M28 family peptidase [Terriglobia bacterium]
MLSYPQRRNTALCAIAVGLVIGACARWGPRPLPPLSLSPAPVRFEGAAAFEFIRVVAEEFPDRVTGTPAAHRAANYLRAQLRNTGYVVTLEPFPLWLRGKSVEGENVIAQSEGDSPENVAIIAHYDSQFTSHQAAEDNASGVGVLLELARALHQSPHSHGLILAATDAEEWGMIGARELTDFLKRHHTVAVISIQYIMAGPPRSVEMNCMGQFAGYTPLWLRQMLLASGRAQGASMEQATGRQEWIERALEVSEQDQGPLLRAGIPAVNVGILSTQMESSRRRHHTAEDVFRDFDPAAFQMLGATVEQAVLSLDEVPLLARGGKGSLASTSVPTSGAMVWIHGGGADDFQVTPGSYLHGGLVYAIQLLLLLPILIAAVFSAHNFAAGDIDLRGWRLLDPVSWIIPPGLATLLLYGLTELNALPRYELYPATPKDPFLYHLPFTVLAVLLTVIVVGSVELQKLRARMDTPPVPFAVKKGILFLWVAMVALVGFLNNPYAMWLFLGAFAYATGLLPPPRGVVRRSVNAALLIAAAAPFAMLLYSFGREMDSGWHIVWYLVLQTAYGVWSPVAVALFLMALVLWAQLFWISVLATHQGAESQP